MEIGHHFEIELDGEPVDLTLYYTNNGKGLYYLVKMDGQDPFYMWIGEHGTWEGEGDPDLIERIGHIIENSNES